MNKKQLIVAWVMGILLSFISFLLTQSSSEILQYLGMTIPIIIIGSLLIHTFREKKK